jgi:NADP-dependent 3-hydroxy acid dehydrogenase YdfG
VPDKIVAKACDRFGVIDILVNNAGVGQGRNPWPKRGFNPASG